MTNRQAVRGFLLTLAVLFGLPLAIIVVAEIVNAAVGSMAPDQLAGIIIIFTTVAYFGLGLYFLPTIVGLCRRVDGLAAVIVVNLFLGWTLAGWVNALEKAFGPAKARVPPS